METILQELDSNIKSVRADFYDGFPSKFPVG